MFIKKKCKNLFKKPIIVQSKKAKTEAKVAKTEKQELQGVSVKKNKSKEDPKKVIETKEQVIVPQTQTEETIPVEETEK